MKIKQLKIINQDESTEIADIGANSENVDYNNTNVKLKLDELSNIKADKTEVQNESTTRQTADNNLQNQINVEKARIDNITQLPEGSTTGDAELIDIRLGEDGVLYPNAGTAVRNQFSKILKYKVGLENLQLGTDYNVNNNTIVIPDSPISNFIGKIIINLYAYQDFTNLSVILLEKIENNFKILNKTYVDLKTGLNSIDTNFYISNDKIYYVGFYIPANARVITYSTFNNYGFISKVLSNEPNINDTISNTQHANVSFNINFTIYGLQSEKIIPVLDNAITNNTNILSDDNKKFSISALDTLLNYNNEETTNNIESTNTISPSAFQNNITYGLYFNERTNLKSWLPDFTEETGTYDWQIIKTTDNMPFTDESTFETVTNLITQNIGDAIVLDDFLEPYMAIVIKNISDGSLKFSTTSSSYRILQCNFNTHSINTSGTRNGSFSGTFIINKLTPKLLDELNPLSGKKIVAIGDSMVQGHTVGYDNTWLALLARKNNMEFVNYGLGGSLTINETRQVGNTTVPGVIARYENMDNDADYIIVFSGTNDCQLEKTIGQENSTNDQEFFGALNLLLQGLLAKYPSGKIAYITPYKNGHHPELMENYVNAIEIACKNNGGIPVFNNMKNGGIDFESDAQKGILFFDDKTHLTADGMQWVVTKYENFLKSL